MTRKQKLELTWIGKDERERLEPRVLIEDEDMGHAAPISDARVGLLDNLLIKGDNLLALKALQTEYSGKVKCVCIDPPYNTGSAFEHYNDGIEHSLWLRLIGERLREIRNLLRDDGSIWITIDDNEHAYLKVLCDETFGRENFLASCVWQHSVQGKGYSGKFSNHHNFVIGYRASAKFTLKDLPREDRHNVNYKNPDNDPNGLWRAGDVRNSMIRKNLMYNITSPSGNVINHPPKGWRFSRERFEAELAAGKIIFNADESAIIRKIYLKDQAGRVPETIWFAEEVGTTREANAEVRNVVSGEFFDTPKPERIIQRILLLSTDPGDIVLDSFAGSGTTGAVAHKMGRRWIMVELGEHADTHIVPRLKKVIDGDDLGGVTEATGWQGGGGYRYYRLAPSLLEKDTWGQYIISKKFKPELLAEAVCKLMGFAYAPSQNCFWQHGHSTERDFIYVTTQRLTREALKKLSHEVGPERTLLVCCRAHDVNTFDNLTVRKMPQAVMTKCEWGRDDYSLNIQEAPREPITPDDLTADADADDEAMETAE